MKATKVELATMGQKVFIVNLAHRKKDLSPILDGRVKSGSEKNGINSTTWTGHWANDGYRSRDPEMAVMRSEFYHLDDAGNRK